MEEDIDEQMHEYYERAEQDFLLQIEADEMFIWSDY
jgi:hypothetical protein